MWVLVWFLRERPERFSPRGIQLKSYRDNEELLIMKVSEIAFVGYPVTDMARARKFYEGVFNLRESRRFSDHWIEYDIGPGTLALIDSTGQNWPPFSGGPAFALEVDDFNAAVANAKGVGAKFINEAFESPICWTAIIEDSEGNRVAIHKRKPPEQRKGV